MTLRQIKNRLRWFVFVDLREKTNKYLAPYRRKLLLGTDFTIISNNCWGGHVYRKFQIPYNSPTIGMYFFPEEYIRFLSNLKMYLSMPLEVVPAYESKYYDYLCTINQRDVLIGKLNDVEIVLLHYKEVKEAQEKWKRRCNRMNWSHLLIKNSMQNGMTKDQLILFDKLDFVNKVCFVPKNTYKSKCTIEYPTDNSNNQIKYDIIHFDSLINLKDWINSSYR